MLNKEYWTEVKEKVEFTLNGWDGKSYNGETRKVNKVYKCKFTPDAKFVKVGKHLFKVLDRMVLEKATGEYHPTVTYWGEWE